jgi:hypothetical protein
MRTIVGIAFGILVVTSGPGYAQQSGTGLPKCRDTQAQCVAKSVSDGYSKSDATTFCLRRKCTTK